MRADMPVLTTLLCLSCLRCSVGEYVVAYNLSPKHIESRAIKLIENMGRLVLFQNMPCRIIRASYMRGIR